MACQGPCLPHCLSRCPVLAYASLAYALGCASYLALSRDLGTFRDSLTEEQRGLFTRSAAARRCAFRTALLAAVAALATWRPLRLA